MLLVPLLFGCASAVATPPPAPASVLHFAQNSDDGGPWVQTAAAVDDALEHFGSEFARTAQVSTYVDGAHHVMTVDWSQGDAEKRHVHSFSPDGALAWFRQTEGAFGDICGEWEGRVEIQSGPRHYKRTFEVSLDGGKPLDPEIAADCPPLDARDPGWQPEWLTWSQVPAVFRDAKAP